MTIHHFDVVSVPVSDQQQSKQFYQQVLGFELIREEAMGPGMSWIQLAPKGCNTTIALVTWFEHMQPGGLQGVMLNVTQIDDEYKRLTGLGLALSEVKQEPWGRYSTFVDPDGNGWILREAPASP